MGGAALLATGLADTGIAGGRRAFAGETAEPADLAAQPVPSSDGQSYLYAFPDRLSGLWGFVDAASTVVIAPAFSAVSSKLGSTMGVCPPVPVGMGGAAKLHLRLSRWHVDPHRGRRVGLGGDLREPRGHLRA